MSYTTVEKVAEYLRTTIDSNTTPSEDSVSDWISWSESVINEETGRIFDTVEEVDPIYIASEKTVYDVWLPFEFTPLISISEVYINNGTDFNTDYTLQTADTDYIIVDKASGHIRFRKPIKTNIRAVKLVTVEHGYEDKPAIVEQLATLLTSNEYVRSSLTSNVSENADGITVGPITVRKSTTQNVSFIRNMQGDINNLMEQLGSFKTYIK